MINKAIALYRLERILGKQDYEEAMAEYCRNAYLHGLLDSSYEMKQISLKEYQEGKECIKALGLDQWGEDFEARFNQSVPVNSHL